MVLPEDPAVMLTAAQHREHHVEIHDLLNNIGPGDVPAGQDYVDSAVAGKASKVEGFVPIAELPAGSTLTVMKPSGGVWPGGTTSTGVRPTDRADVTVIWAGADPSPAIVASGTAGMLNNVDLRFVI